jgi:hypothetical protein
MRILLFLNLLLAIAAVGTAVMVREHQVLVWHDLDEMLHWSPVSSNRAAILLPLESSRSGSSYRLQFHLAPPEGGIPRDIGSGIRIEGQDGNGNVFEVYSSPPELSADGRAAATSIKVQDDGVSYVAIDFDACLRSQVAVVGVGASDAEIKARSVDASITRSATGNLILILGAVLVIQIASLLVLVVQRQRRVKVGAVGATLCEGESVHATRK